MQQKIVITGGPGTGKSTLLEELMKRDFTCMPEISRKITIEAKKNGIDQLFLKNPLLFSQLVLEAREEQFMRACEQQANFIFFDRGIPDVHGYMNYLGVDYPKNYVETSKKHRYDHVFLLPPWEQIYLEDNERYESFEQSVAINNHLKRTYQELDYFLIEVPIGTIEKRIHFILNSINL